MAGQNVIGDWRDKLYVIIYRSNTPGGRLFNIALLICIVLSIAVVMLDSIASVRARHGELLFTLEWVFTILFTIEYILRIVCISSKWRYIFSAMGLIDLLSILPAFVSLVLPNTQFLLVLRSMRLMRVFRVFELAHFLDEGQYILKALAGSYRKISIFMLFIVVIVIIVGSVMYLVEGGTNGFVSIPDSIYWAIVTITTVGYGDISPVTPLGKFLAILLMLCGYSIIAVPTGIVTSEIVRTARKKAGALLACARCGKVGHEPDARYCRVCGEKLPGIKENPPV